MDDQLLLERFVRDVSSGHSPSPRPARNGPERLSPTGKHAKGDGNQDERWAPRSSVDGYFSILTDTLLGHFLPAYTPGLKVHERTHPKFYWFDPGVARAAAGMLRDPVDRLWQGVALETLIFHELRVHNEVSQNCRPIAHYRTAAGVEIDFLVETRKRTASAAARVLRQFHF